MESIEHNNRERIKDLGSKPSSEMSKREHIATEAMSALIKSMNIHTDSGLDQVADIATKMADEMIRRINQ